jgi:hypothetical protein
MIDKECFNKLKKLILDGPKYRVPLTEGVDNKFFSVFFNDPEKLFQVAFSLSNFSTVDFDKQVKFPNLILWPVNAKVKNL